VSGPMTHTSHRILPIEQLNTEWETLGRTDHSVSVLRRLAARDQTVARVVTGDATTAGCATPYELVAHMRRASGPVRREEAAELVRIMLREAALDPFVPRLVIQAMVPGMVTVAGKLRWGQGGEWAGADAFFAELLSTTWMVVADWAGQDRPYAVMDLLSAVRCRMRRTLLRQRELGRLHVGLTPPLVQSLSTRDETELESIARQFVELTHDGMRRDEVEVLYAQHVLGYTIAELSALTGRDRRTLYTRRDRGLRRLCA